MAISLKQLLEQSGGSSGGGQTDMQWVQANEKHRALQELLDLELAKQRREEEAAQGVMDLTSGYGTPGQRAEQLFAPRPQLAQALSQFGGNEFGAPETGSNVPSFTDFGSPGQMFAQTFSGGNIDLGMKGISRVDPESLTGINREAYRSAIGLKGPDSMESFKQQQAHDLALYNRSMADQAARDARLEKQQAQQTVENEKKAALIQAEQERKERATFMYTNKQLYLATANKQDDFYKQQLAILQGDLGKALTKTDRARIASAIQDTKATWEAEQRLRPSLGQIMREALKEYELIRTGKGEEPTQENVGISAAKRAIVSLSPEDQSSIVHAYNLTPEQIAVEASQRGWTPEQVLKVFLAKMRNGISPSGGKK